mgnify:FL=1
MLSLPAYTSQKKCLVTPHVSRTSVIFSGARQAGTIEAVVANEADAAQRTAAVQAYLNMTTKDLPWIVSAAHSEDQYNWIFGPLSALRIAHPELDPLHILEVFFTGMIELVSFQFLLIWSSAAH